MPRGDELVALVVAVAAALAVTVLAVGAAVEIASPTGHLSEQASSVLSTAIGALIGATAARIGRT